MRKFRVFYIGIAVAMLASGANGAPPSSWRVYNGDDAYCDMTMGEPDAGGQINYGHVNGSRRIIVFFGGTEMYDQKVTYELGSSSFTYDATFGWGPGLGTSLKAKVTAAFEKAFEDATAIRLLNERGELMVALKLPGQKAALKKMGRKCSPR